VTSVIAEDNCRASLSPVVGYTRVGLRKSAVAKKARPAAAASRAGGPAASASPAKFTLGDLFKAKTSASASAVAANPAPAASTRAETATNETPSPGKGARTRVVNTNSHVYHKEGSRFYGKAKKGKYVSEQEAIKEGDSAVANE
jgi:hypothetical protein